MVRLLPSLLATTTLLTTASTHGFLGAIEVNGVNYTGWRPFEDRFVDPQPIRATRPYRDNGPVDDFTTPAITCNNYPNMGPNGGPGAPGNDGSHVSSIPVKPGDVMRLIWDSWSIPHPGPVMTYLAPCNGPCTAFNGSTGAAWVKIDQLGYNRSSDPAWGSLLLMQQGATWRVTVPRGLVAGEYVLRHEILGLQAAAVRMGAQFYPSCAHLKVEGNGTERLPEGVALPGAYDPDDTDGIHVHYIVDVEMGGKEYVAPGGDVWSSAAAQLNGV